MMKDLFQKRYYRINKMLLSIIGQWPCQSRTRRLTTLIIFIVFAISQIIPKIIAVVEWSDDPEIIIESIPPFVVDIACLTKLANIAINTDKPKLRIVFFRTEDFVDDGLKEYEEAICTMLELINRMKIDWKSLTNEPEIGILHFYAEVGRQFTIAYAVGLYAVTAVFMTQPVLPRILETLKQADDRQPKKFIFPVDYYGIDFQTYYYYLLIPSYTCVTSMVTIIIAADTMFIVYVQHACAMFAAVGHQLERIGDAVPENFDIHLPSSKDPVYQQMIIFIKKHSEAIQFANLLEASYTWAFFSLVGFNMVVMSVTGYQTVMRMDKSFDEALRFGTFTIAQLVHLFFQSYFSQKLMDHSEKVRDHMYQAKWYKTSICAQKLLNLITMRTYVPCQLTAGKFLVMSLDNFTSIVKTSMSYFTLLRSVQ